MSFFKIKTDVKSVSEGSGGNYITKSGIYDVTLKTVSVAVNQQNARSLNFNVDHKGSEQMFYGLRLDNNDGSANYQSEVFNKLCVVVGIEGEVSNPETQTHKVGKDQVEKDLAVLTDFDDQEVKMRVQLVYSRWQGEIRESKDIKAFYRGSDGATAQEIIQGGKVGEQIAKDETYSGKASYKDGLTEADIVEWKAAKQAGRQAQTPAASNSFQAGGSPATSFPA